MDEKPAEELVVNIVEEKLTRIEELVEKLVEGAWELDELAGAAALDEVEEIDKELLLDAQGYPVNQSGLIRVTAPVSAPPGGLACFVVKVLK